MSLRTTQQLGQGRNSLYLLLGLATGFWTLFYKFVGDRLIIKFLPSSAVEAIHVRKVNDKVFEKTVCIATLHIFHRYMKCRINGTAFFHALLVSPLMGIVLARLAHDRMYAESSLHNLVAIVVAGYFSWDLYVSIAQYKEYGFSFLLHCLICLSCMIFHFVAHDMRTSFVIAGMIFTEISTIFLHLRWFLIQGGRTHTIYFKLVNMLFLTTFISIRMIAVVKFNILPYTMHVLTLETPNLGAFDTFRIYYQMVVSWIWVALQYYWGYALAKSQVQQAVKKWTKGL